MMNIHKVIRLLVLFFLLGLTTIDITLAQSRNLHIEGAGDQYGIIQSTSTGNSSVGIELLRGNAFNSTDWRIRNMGGSMYLETATDNFIRTSEAQVRIGSSGRMNIYNGSNAAVDNNDSGVLILGDPNSLHVALDDQGIIARNNEIGSRLLIQTGAGTGDTYLNNLSGEVGIGTLAPQAKLGIEDDGFQLRMANADDISNEWYIGASRSGWSVGADKLVFSPSSSSGDAMLILNSVDEVISARNNRVANVGDPTSDQDAVNLRTLNARLTELMQALDASSSLSPKNISLAASTQLTFADCAEYCRDLVEDGYSDWTVPSIEQASHFIGWTISSQDIWSSNIEDRSFGLWQGATNPPWLSSTRVRLYIDIQNGHIDYVSTNLANPTDRHCRCVR